MNRPYSKPVIHYFTGSSKYVRNQHVFFSTWGKKQWTETIIKNLSIEKMVTYKINEINQQWFMIKPFILN